VKQTPKEERIAHRLAAGVLSQDGFLGTDDRHVYDIIKADGETLAGLNVTLAELADRMQYFADQSFTAYDGDILIDDHYRVENRSERGRMVCPFSHPGAYAKGMVILTNEKNGLRVQWTPLLTHMIREHGFFEGIGARHRVEPEILVKALFD
jgi:hypothetical protein